MAFIKQGMRCFGVGAGGKLSARVDESGQIRFKHALTGAELLAEQPQHFMWPGARLFQATGGDLWHLETNFTASEGERFYGLGQRQHGLLNQKGIVQSDVRKSNAGVGKLCLKKE